MPAIYEFPHTVVAEEIDGQGHVNNLDYVKWMQWAAVAHSTAQNWPSRRYHEIGLGWVARSHFIEYLKPAFVDEEIVILTWVTDFRKVTSRRKYRIVRPADATLLAVAETNWAFVDLATHSPRRIPPEVYESFIEVPQDEEPQGV